MAMPKYQMSTPDPALAGKTWGGSALHGDPVGMTGGMPPLGPAGGFHGGAQSGGIVNPMGGGMSGTPPFMKPAYRPGHSPADMQAQMAMRGMGAPMRQPQSMAPAMDSGSLPWETTNSVLAPPTGALQSMQGALPSGEAMSEGVDPMGSAGGGVAGGLPLGMGGPTSGGAPGMTMPGAAGSTPTPPNPVARQQLAQLLSANRR